VKDLGADGIDIDYEPARDPGCHVDYANKNVSCLADAEYQDVVGRLRAVLPRPYIVTLAG